MFVEPPTTTCIPQDTTTPSSHYFMEIECKVCTYFNIGREKCEMCDSDLLG